MCLVPHVCLVYICQPVFLSVCQCVLYAFLSVLYTSASLSFSPSVSVYCMSSCLSCIHLPACLSLRLSVCQCIILYIVFLPVCLCFHLYVCRVCLSSVYVCTQWCRRKL